MLRMRRQNALPASGKIPAGRIAYRAAIVAFTAATLPLAIPSPGNTPPPPPTQQQSAAPSSSNAESELRLGISLTQQGRFSDAIPHFLNARGRVADEYAANFNLALCYIATKKFADAIAILTPMRPQNATAAVNNLLAQAYVGLGDYSRASESFQQAVEKTPSDEKLYLFIADACLDRGAYDFGLQVLNAGLSHLPHSARMHYERGIFFSFENDPDAAVADFDLARKSDPQSDIAYMAAGQKELLEGHVPEAVGVTREGIKKGHSNYILLTIFADAVLRSGAQVGTPDFSEAESALKQSITEKPSYADSHAFLGELYLSAGQIEDAINELETARKLGPESAPVYSHLAMAYRRKGDAPAAETMLAKLAALNQQESARYKTEGSANRDGYISSARLPH